MTSTATTTERVEVRTKAAAEKAIKAGKNINIVAGTFLLTLTDVNVSIWVSGTSAPRIETRGTSAPRIETRDTSAPLIVTWHTSAPHIVTWHTSTPRIETWDTSAPHAPADAQLRGDLRFVKADYFLILSLAHSEIPALIVALRAGKVDGSTYSGACVCLVGTLENAGAKGLPHLSDSPAEKWFVPIRPGTKPGDDGEGGYRSARALEWALEYCALTGIEIDQVQA